MAKIKAKPAPINIEDGEFKVITYYDKGSSYEPSMGNRIFTFTNDSNYTTLRDLGTEFLIRTEKRSSKYCGVYIAIPSTTNVNSELKDAFIIARVYTKSGYINTRNIYISISGTDPSSSFMLEGNYQVIYPSTTPNKIYMTTCYNGEHYAILSLLSSTDAAFEYYFDYLALFMKKTN